MKARVQPSNKNARASHVHVRGLEIGDFAFVQELASKQPTFTVPPSYVLWLLLKIKGAVCLVAEHSTGQLLAYLLAVPIKGTAESLFIWQLAASEGQYEQNSILAILGKVREAVAELGVERLFFSTIPNSPIHRAIRRYASKFVLKPPATLNALPPSVSTGEHEFVLNLAETLT